MLRLAIWLHFILLHHFRRLNAVGCYFLLGYTRVAVRRGNIKRYGGISAPGSRLNAVYLCK